MNRKRILFVCTGNICRSPAAEGMFRKMVNDAGLEDVITVDSAGTHAYRKGAPPDANAIKAAAKRGVDIGELQARLFDWTDFYNHDLILAMDWENHDHVLYLCPAGEEAKLRMLMSYASRSKGRKEVPDPYGGGYRGFEKAMNMIEDACTGLLSALREELAARTADRP
jgi:protein-tyrosine phosphatase